MKLPEEKNERIKIFLLIGIGTVAVLYGAIAGVIKPTLRRRQARLEAIQELSEKLDQAQRKIEQMNRNRKPHVEQLNEILTVTSASNHVLRPRLGNYLLSAREAIENAIAECGVDLQNVREVGISQLPQPSGKQVNAALNVYTANVGMECGIFDLAAVIRRIEESNPMIAVSGVTVSANPKTPDRHTVTVSVQWPVWADPEKPERLEEQLDRIEQGSRGRAVEASNAGSAAVPAGGSQ